MEVAFKRECTHLKVEVGAKGVVYFILCLVQVG